MAQQGLVAEFFWYYQRFWPQTKFYRHNTDSLRFQRKKMKSAKKNIINKMAQDFQLRRIANKRRVFVDLFNVLGNFIVCQ